MATGSFLDPLRRIRQRMFPRKAVVRREHGKSRDSYAEQPLPHGDQLLQLFHRDDALTVFDVGACEGLDSVRYARLFPNARIYAFEPLPDNAAECRRIAEKFDECNISVYNIALSDSEGTTAFHSSCGAPAEFENDEDWNFGNKSSSLLKPNSEKIKTTWPWLSFRPATMVESTTLDVFCGTHGINTISLIHMDVQGAELLVLKGAGSMLNSVQSIWLEVSSERFYDDQPLADDIASFLSRYGFERRWTLGNEPQWDELWVRRA